MEPPKPSKNETTEGETSKILSFKIMNQEVKDQNFLVDLIVEEDNLLIHMKSYESKIKLKYESKFALSGLLKINKYFKLFDTLEEIAQNINDLNKKNLISVLKNHNDNYDFILNLELNKEKIQIKLELLYKDNNQLIEIIEIFHSLEKENKELKESLNEYKTKLERNEMQLNQLLKLHKMNSSIMFEIDELNLVTNEIEKQMNKKVNCLKQFIKGQKMEKV